MKAIVQDANVFKNLQPSAVEAYLQRTGWHERSRIAARVSAWTRDTFEADKLKVYVPLDQEFDDYPRRMFELIETLEKAENRSQLEILSDLINNYYNLTVQGVVMQIQPPIDDQLKGQITLIGVVVEKMRKIYLNLADRDYVLAVKAYQERLPVICQGDLFKKDDVFVLKNISNFAIDETWVS
jgi:hypothetical protein